MTVRAHKYVESYPFQLELDSTSRMCLLSAVGSSNGDQVLPGIEFSRAIFHESLNR